MRSRAPLMLLLFACAPATRMDAPIVTSGPVALPWLAGCWEARDGERVTREIWDETTSGAMTGVARTIQDGAETFGETLRIDRTESGLVYTAIPRGQAPARFVLTERTALEAVFENPEHDFPRRIIYRRDGDALTATIDGGASGAPDDARSWSFRPCVASPAGD